MLQTLRRHAPSSSLPWQRRFRMPYNPLSRRIEPVELCTRRFAYQPWRFRWRGQLYRVQQIQRVWERAERRYRPARRYFAVVCGNEGTYTLFQDLQVGTWHLVC